MTDKPNWVWLVWALKRGEARLVVVCTTVILATEYMDTCAPLYPGFKLIMEPVALDHAFAANDSAQALALGRLRG